MSAPYLGDFAEDVTIYHQWGTNDGDGASITRATDGEVRVYKDNNVAQSTAGVTDTEDFDGLTGVHLVTVDTSADPFYSTGSDYKIVLQGAVVDGETVNAGLASFSIENRFAEVDVVEVKGAGVAGVNDFKAVGFSTHNAAAVVTAMQAVAASFKATGFSTHTAANVVTAMQAVAASFKATGFSTHSAANVVTAMQAVAASFKATGFSTHNAAAVKTAIEAAGSHLALIMAKTDNLPPDPADASDLVLLFDALPTAAEIVTAMQAVAASFKATGFSTHDAAAVVTAMLVVAASFKATGFSTHSAADVTGGTTVAQAETNIRGEDDDTLKTLADDIAGVGGAVGSGADSVTVTLHDGDGNPIADADLWISTDEAGSNVVAGTVQTDSSGQYTFLLDAGTTYYRWAQKDGVNFDNPQSFDAVAD